MTKTDDGLQAHDIEGLGDDDCTMIERSIERLLKPRKEITIHINLLWVAAILLTTIWILFS